MAKKRTEEEIRAKWFVDEGWEFPTVERTAKTLQEAWEKTLAKWSLPNTSITFYLSMPSCGLCDKFFVQTDCTGCPIAKVTGKKTCRGFKAYGKMLKLEDNTTLTLDEHLKAVERVRLSGLKELLKIKEKSETK